jgi:hypothetical protein
MRIYKKNKKGLVGYFDTEKKDTFYTAIFTVYPECLDDYADATPDEIEQYLKTEKNMERLNKNNIIQEEKLLQLCKLKHSDFFRFRSVYEEEGILFVTTRENGMGGRSIDAIQNENYIKSYADEFDATYEHYEFKIPS